MCRRAVEHEASGECVEKTPMIIIIITAAAAAAAAADLQAPAARS